MNVATLNTRALLRAVFSCVVGVSTGVAHAADDEVPFVVVEDDGTVEDTLFDTQDHASAIINSILAGYGDRELPEVLSVWTAFPFSGNTIQTNFVPIKNDITGIGLENAYGTPETFDQLPPLRAMLIHNDFTQLDERASFERLPSEGFGEYLFLLELSHLWGPEIRLPAAGGAVDRLIGFDFHWSFFVDAGGSPIGGNAWVNNGDGTFTAPVFNANTVTYSPLDLYLMGLAPASDVAPFGFLHDVVVPEDAPVDPFTGDPVATVSFPWQGPAPLTVSATREEVSIDDVIAANGERVPAFGAAPTSFTLGIVLLVPSSLQGEDRLALERDFAPFAAKLAPAFARATGDRGSLEVITASPAPEPAPVVVAEGEGDDGGGEESNDDGCAAAGVGNAAVLGVVALALAARRRRA